MQSEKQLDVREFRNTLSTFTTGVTIITTRAADGTPVGLTANSFNSVSLDPPMVLWSLAKTSRALQAFDAAENWAVHILSVEQDELSNRFAKSGEDKFAGVKTQDGIDGIPLLSGCTARLQCRTTFKYEGGDHIIFVGEVLDFDRSDIPPLVFHAGKYAVATKKTDSTSTSRPPVRDLDTSFGEDFLDYLLARAHFQMYAFIRENARLSGLSDPEYFVLSTLTAKDGRSLNELNTMISITGQELTPKLIEGLAASGMLRPVDVSGSTRLYLTEKGRDLALHIIAAAKAVESDVLAKFGYWEAVSLKNLLKQFVQITDPGLPDMWGTELPDCDRAA